MGTPGRNLAMENGDVKKCDLVIWAILLINKMYVLRLENRQAASRACLRSKPNFVTIPNPTQPNPFILFYDVTWSLALKMQIQLLYILPFLVEQVVSQQLSWNHTKQIEQLWWIFDIRKVY